MKRIIKHYKNVLNKNDFIDLKGEVDRIEEDFLVVLLQNNQKVLLDRYEYNDLNVGDQIIISTYLFDVKKNSNETRIIKEEVNKLQTRLFS